VGTALRISHLVNDRAVIVRAIGEVDLVTAPVLDDSLRQASTLATPPKQVVADLSGVYFLASAGLSVLLDLHELCRDRRTPLRVVAGTQATRRSLQITGLDQVLDVVGSVRALGPTKPV
jgi:anti-sigma B factor antagonist